MTRDTKSGILGAIGILGGVGVLMILYALHVFEYHGALASGGTHEIVYRVSGTAASSKITYTNETNGTTIVQSGVDTQIHMFFEHAVELHSGDMAYLTAQNDGQDGTVVAEIWYDGRLAKHSESSGAYCIATVSGLVK